MNWRPWRRRSETRQSTQPFTDAIIAAIASQAGGTLPADPLGLAALEMAAGAYARAFAGASLTPAVPALTPAIRADLGRSLIRRGEAVYLIEVRRGALRLTPAGSWDIRGGPDPESWMYRADIFGPSGNLTRFVPGAAVLHPMFSYDPARPWLGLSPLQWASLTGALAGNLEKRLGEETGGPVGHVVPVPQDPDAGDDEDDNAEEKPLDQLRKDLAGLAGRTAIVETTAAAWGEGPGAAPQTDWQPRRFGANPPAALGVLRSDVGQAVLAACGTPPSLFIANSDGTAQREAWRRFVMGSVEPLAEIIGGELADKLDAPGLRFDFAGLWAHDLAGRAQAFKQMTTAGMDLAKAAALAGLLTEE